MASSGTMFPIMRGQGPHHGSAALHIPAVSPTFSTVPHSSTVGV